MCVCMYGCMCESGVGIWVSGCVSEMRRMEVEVEVR